MRAFKRFLLVVLLLGVLSGAAFGVLSFKRAADARSLDGVIVEPAPPQPPAPKEEKKLDARLEGLLPRKDGARLLLAPEAGTHLFSAGFIDNGTLILSATSAQGKETRWDILRVDVTSAAQAALFSGTTPRLVSSHRPAHRNAGRLCYAERDTKRNVFEVWCSDLEGRNPRQVTKHDGTEDILSPTISPDGAWIAFEVVANPIARLRQGQAPPGSTIWKARFDGSDLQQLTRGADDRAPSWSDDGRKLYFQRRAVPGKSDEDGEPRWDIYAMDADGKNPYPLLRTHEEDESFPVRRAATDDFVIVEASTDLAPRLKMIDVVTKAGEYLTDGKSGPETSPSLSPDGKLAAFLAPVDPDHPETLGLWLVSIGQ